MRICPYLVEGAPREGGSLCSDRTRLGGLRRPSRGPCMTPDGDRTSVTLTSGREPDAALGAPRCSVIIPCRNEEKYIARCLDSIIANVHPKNRVEASGDVLFFVPAWNDHGATRRAERS